MDKEAIRLLDRLYKDLYKSDEVINHGSGNVYDKFNNIENYISDLERIHNKVSETGRHKDYLKKLYYDKYVIKKEDIPESYYQHQQEIALERGYGHVDITDEMKQQLQEDIINNQKARLDTWLDYFLSEDASVYPFWAKYWSFQGMLKLGTYDKEKGTFNRRTKDTVEPFCDLNREALALSIDMLIKMLKKEDFDDKELELLVKTGSFQKIYTYILNNVLKDNKNVTKRNIGKWVKYAKGSDHMPLVNSLQGYNTGWCTAGESTAKSQLEQGDFYVYYTLDENEEYKVPRIAIRMEYGSIAEIRGVAQDQNLEPEMEEVVEEKIKDFPDKEEYYKKVNDMKLLTRIYKKHQNKEELTKEELRFLYEIDDDIKGFGYEKDPRIEEIIKERRRRKKDLAFILDCDVNEIATSEKEINDNTIYYVGSLLIDEYKKKQINKQLILPKIVIGSIFISLDDDDNDSKIKFSEIVTGNLKIWRLTNAKDITLPKKIGKTLSCTELKSAKNIVFPKEIGKNLVLNKLKNIENVKFPDMIGEDLHLSLLEYPENLELPNNVGGSIYLNSLKTVEGLELPEQIEGNLDLSGLTSARGLNLPEIIKGDLDFRNLNNDEGLVLPQIIEGSLYLRGLTSAKGLKFPKEIKGILDLSKLAEVEDLILPEKIGKSLFLSRLLTVEGVKLPQSVGGTLDLQYLSFTDNIEFPEIVGGDLRLERLISAKDTKFPKEVKGNLYISSLVNIDEVVFPQTVGSLSLGNLNSAMLPNKINGYLSIDESSLEDCEISVIIDGDLHLRNLKTAKNLNLPNKIGGSLILTELIHAENLILPETVGKTVYIKKLESADGIVIPEPLTYTIVMNGFLITPENVNQYRRNKKK